MSTKKYQEDLKRLVGLEKANNELPPQPNKPQLDCSRGIGTMNGESVGGNRTTKFPQPPSDTVDDVENGNDGSGNPDANDPSGTGTTDDGNIYSPECTGGRVKNYFSGCVCPTGKYWNGSICLDNIADLITGGDIGGTDSTTGSTGLSETKYAVNGVGGLYDCTTGDAVEVYFETPTQPAEAGGTEASTEENSTIPLPVHKCSCATECVSYDPDDSYVAGTYASFGETVGLYPSGFSYGYSINNLPTPIVDWGTPTAPYLGYYYTYEYPYIQDTPNPDGFITIYSYRRKYNATNDQLDSEGPVGIGALNGCNYLNNPDYCNAPYQGICVEGEVCDEYPWKAYDCYQPAEGCEPDGSYTEGKYYAVNMGGVLARGATLNELAKDWIAQKGGSYQYVFTSYSGARICIYDYKGLGTSEVVSEILPLNTGALSVGEAKRFTNGFGEYWYQYNCNGSAADYCNPADDVLQHCSTPEQCCPPTCTPDSYVEGKYWHSEVQGQFVLPFSVFEDYAQNRVDFYQAANPQFTYSYSITSTSPDGNIIDFQILQDGTPTVGDRAERSDCFVTADEGVTAACNPNYGDPDTENCHWQSDGVQQYTWTPEGLKASDLDPDADTAKPEAEQPKFCDANGKEVTLIKGKDGGAIVGHNLNDPDVSTHWYGWRDPATGRLSFFDNTKLSDYQAKYN